MNEHREQSVFWRVIGLLSLLITVALIWNRGAYFLKQLQGIRMFAEDYGLITHPITDSLLAIPTWGYCAGFLGLTVVLIAKEVPLNHRPISSVVNLATLAVAMTVLNVWLSAFLYDSLNLASALGP